VIVNVSEMPIEPLEEALSDRAGGDCIGKKPGRSGRLTTQSQGHRDA